MRKKSLVFLSVLFLGSATLLRAESVRAGHVAVLGHWALGTITAHFGGEAGLAAEYGLHEMLGLGAGATIVAGVPEVRLCLEVYAKGYFFETPLDLFAAPMFRIAVAGGYDAEAALRIGLEWQTPWWLFASIQQEMLFQLPGVDFLGGISVGVRF